MKIVLVGAGTAGHITPLLAVADRIRSRSPQAELHYIGQKHDSNASVMELRDDVTSHRIQAGKYRRYHNESWWRKLTDFRTIRLNLRDAWRVVVGAIQAYRLMKQLRPDVVFLKGGYIVVPVGWACRLLRIRYITHDSDTIPGLANRLIGARAYKHAVALESVTAYPKDKTVVVGVPITADYQQRANASRHVYKRKLGFEAESTLLFVYGGSQGSRVIDTAMDHIAPALMQKYPALHIAHIVGRLNEANLTTLYSGIPESSKVRIRTLGFINNAYDYIAAADIIVSRAGATSLAEIAAVGRAAIIVPAEQLTGGHQLHNARHYARDRAISIVHEVRLEEELGAELVRLLDNPAERRQYEDRIRRLAIYDAADKIAELIIQSAPVKESYRSIIDEENKTAYQR